MDFIFVSLFSDKFSWLRYLNNESIKVVYTDIQKPFDSVSHQRVIKTLTQHRLHESLVNWFKEYLRNR